MSRPRPLPPLPTYEESAASCDENLSAALDRAAAGDLHGYEMAKATAEAQGWRTMRDRYRAEIAARPALARMPIRMPGNFAPAGAAEKAERHWTDREPGADDE